VVVRMRVFSVLSTAPRGSASCLKRSKKKRTSSWCRRTLQSSTYAKMMPRVPRLSSPGSPLICRCSAQRLSSFWMVERMSLSTIAAKTGETGHPWVNPSVTEIISHSPFSSRTKVWPESS
jgi:hypothetical protein